jgi:deazaflavin-dependent oxidoreductase (nitroreductase family)
MAGPTKSKDLVFKAGSTLHRSVLHLTGGRLGARAFGMPTLELHTIGRVSGRPRTAMLTAPVRDGDTVVLVASKGGDDRDPDWFKNLVAHPDAEITMDGRRWPVRARVAGPEERQELWAKAVAAHKGYAGYQRKTSRTIPVVVCEPR